MRLMEYAEKHGGIVVEEMDFRLAPDTVRNPDVAFLTAEQARDADIDVSPATGAPALAIEVISPYNSAQDMAKKVRQYLAAGSSTVWIVYPTLRIVEVHDSSGVSQIEESGQLTEPNLLPGFSLAMSYIFGER